MNIIYKYIIKMSFVKLFIFPTDGTICMSTGCYHGMCIKLIYKCPDVNTQAIKYTQLCDHHWCILKNNSNAAQTFTII